MRSYVFSSLTPLIGTSEFTLTIALVVFVMLTAILLFIILLLCISKSFRAFFFRDAAKRKKAAAKKNKQAAANADVTPITETQSRSNDAIQKPARSRRSAEAAEPQPEEKPAKRASRSTAKSKDPDIYDGVITVPLNFPAPVSNDETRGKTGGRRNSSRDESTYDGDDVTTVALPRTTPQAQQSDRKRVYAPRTVTITRARPSSESTQTQTAEKRASQSNAQSRKKN